jgi:hypothetical protein
VDHHNLVVEVDLIGEKEVVDMLECFMGHQHLNQHQ